MDRHRLLALGGATVPIALTGCVEPPGSGRGAPSDEVPVRIVSRAEQPAVPIEYDAEMVESLATNDHPARLRVAISNPTDAEVVLGEERDVQFHHVSSAEDTLYLHPASEEAWEGPVEAGCWRLTDHVAVPEYYGLLTIQAGETVRAESYVYGHPDLPADVCLPEGDHRIHTTGIAGADEEAVIDHGDATEFEWELTLRVGD